MLIRNPSEVIAQRKLTIEYLWKFVFHLGASIGVNMGKFAWHEDGFKVLNTR